MISLAYEDLQEGAQIAHLTGFITEAQAGELMDRLRSEVTFEQRSIRLFGRSVLVRM